jgi:hypothetical protein
MGERDEEEKEQRTHKREKGTNNRNIRDHTNGGKRRRIERTENSQTGERDEQ